MSTMRCCSTWNWLIGWPNCLRCLVYSSVPSCRRRSTPQASPQTATVASSITASTSGRPSPSTPIRASAGTETFSKQHLRRARAVHGRIVAGGEAGRSLVDQEHRDAAGVALGAAGAGGDDQVVGPGRADDHRLVAVQQPAAAVLARRGLQVGPVVAPLRLGGGEGEDRLAGDDLADQLGRGRMVRASEEAAADDDRPEVGLDHQRRAELLHDHHGLGGAAAEAAQVLRQRRAQDAEVFGERLPHPWPPPRLRLQRRAPGLEVVVVGEVGREAVSQEGLFFGEAEVHALAFSRD